MPASGSPRVAASVGKAASSRARRLLPGFVLLATLVVPAGSSRATMIVNAIETGGDVVISFSGSVNLAAWSLWADPGFPRPTLIPQTAEFALGPEFPFLSDVYELPLNFSGPTSIYFFPFGGLIAFASSGTGNSFGLSATGTFMKPAFAGAGEYLFVPSGYLSGDPLSGASTWTTRTLRQLGLTVGTYTWSWGSGPTADSVVLNVIPEPAATVLLISGMLGVAVRGRRRRA